MKKTFDNLQTGIKNILPGVGNILKGTLFLIGESFLELKDLFVEKWSKSKSWLDRISTILAGLLIGSFLVYGLVDLYSVIEHQRNKPHYEKVLYNNNKEDIINFFNKNNERFLARDCDFFMKVGADEAMYDKYGHEAYPKEQYKNFCENFYQTQEKRLIPIKIGELEKTGDKYRLKGEMVVVTRNQGEPYYVQMMHYELWKKLDWDLWHFNGDKKGPRNIETKVRN